MSTPPERPDEWLAPDGKFQQTSHEQPRRAAGVWEEDATPQKAWSPPSAAHWQPPYGYVVAAPVSRSSTLRNGLALLVTFAVVTALILGVGLARWGEVDESLEDGAGRPPTVPGPLTTPSVAPENGGYPVRNPPPPPEELIPEADPTTGEWELPSWTWDELPVLADGADANWTALQSPQLAGLEAPVLTSCAAPVTVTDQKSYEQAVREQWRCVHEAWLPILRTLGLPESEPEVRFYPGTSGPSLCGRIEAPAFYCPLEKGTAHFGGDAMEVAMYWGLMVHDTVHHEYAHHIQNVVGIMDAAESVAYTADIDRRLELQATCWASAMTIQDEAVEFDDDLWDEWRLNLDESIPDEEHGTLESLRYWGTRGLYATTLGDCNTWSVAPERVS